MKFFKTTILLSSLVTLLGSCGNYDEGTSSSQGFREVSEIQASFATVSSQIFVPHCIRCHQQYENYESVKIESNQILAAVLSNRMPKNASPLSDDLKALLAGWIQAGAPFSNQDDAPPIKVPSDELLPTWESLSQKVIIPKCVVCHNPNGQASFLDLSTKQAFFENRDRDFFGQKLLDFDQPQDSFLISIITDEFEPMPPLPPISNIGRLSEKEVDTLIEWIKKGIP